MTRKIGFIGLGKMGRRMARVLLTKGFPLVVYDIRDEAVNEAVKLGAQKASSAKEVAEKSEVIMSSLPTPRDVEDVYLGKNGVLEGIKPGSVIIELSTIDPGTSIKIAQEAAKRGAHYLDCPVSGGPEHAEKGELTIFVGGDYEAFKSVEEILRVIGKNVNYIGKTGAGNIVKLTNNIMSLLNILVASEALVFGVKAGLDADALFNVLNTGAGRSYIFTACFPRVLEGDFRPHFSLDYAIKDLGIALDYAKKLKIPMPMVSLAHTLYQMASATGRGNDDFTAVICLLEELSGVKVRSKKTSSDT
ncbi:MAG: NAD(P)-dependent oxidoreductase [candidate division WOR-3 bacterium]